MPIGVTDFPELRAPTRVNPINEALGSAINSYYRPQEKSADVSLKQAQANQANATANFTAPQIAATLLANPTIRDTLGKEAVDRLTKYASQALDAGVMRGTNQMYGGQNGSPLINFLHSAFGHDHLNQQPSSSQQMPDSSTQQSTTMQPPPISDTNGQVQPTVMQNTATNRLAAAVQNPGSQGGVNPASVGAAQEKATETTATTEAGNIQAQWKAKQDAHVPAAENATNALVQNRNVLHGYAHMSPFEKGPVFGNVPAVTTAAQDFDRYAETRANLITQGFSGNNLTGPQMDQGHKLKPNRSNTEGSIHDAMAFDNGLQMRILQHQAFDKKANDLGLLPSEADVLWTRYINEKPFWDPENKKILRKNMDYDGYFTPEKVKWARSPNSETYMKTQAQNGNVSPTVAANDASVKEEENNTFQPSPQSIEMAKSITFPKFATPDDFQIWFNKQPEVYQDAIQVKLMNDKNRKDANSASKKPLMHMELNKYAGTA